MAIQEDIIICDCHSAEHQIIFKYDDDYFDSDWDMVYVDIHLANGGFWRRLKHGIRYIFGYKSRYGAFDEILIKPEDADKLQKVVNYLNDIKERREKKKQEENQPKTRHISELFNRNKEE